MMPKNKIQIPEQPPLGNGQRGSTTQACTKCSCSIKLDKKRTLIPLGLVLYANNKINLGPTPQTEWLQHISPTALRMIAQPGVNDDPELELIDFMLTINCDGKKAGETVLDSAKIEIKDASGKTIYSEDLSKPKARPSHGSQGAPNYLAQGSHRWQWDGYDDNNILDTANLKKGKLKIILETTGQGLSARCEKVISCKSPDSDWSWIGIKVDRNSKSVDMLWRVNLEPHPDPSVNADLVQLSLEGIAKHWSYTMPRYLNVNETYTVKTSAVNNIQPYMSEKFDLYITDNLDNRSTSFPALEKVYYYKIQKWPASYSQDVFRRASAHEVGHIVLNRAYEQDVERMDVSWEHKGTSTYGQKTLPDSPKYPGTGDADLMWYYADHYDSPPSPVKARKEDIRGAIWLAQLEFKEK